jgi:hypothetical protein
MWYYFFMSVEKKLGSYTNRSMPLKVARTICAAAIVYGGANAAIDFGGGLEASHLASNTPSVAPEYQSAIQDEHDTFHDAEKQALIAVVGAAGLMLTRKRDD